MRHAVDETGMRQGSLWPSPWLTGMSTLRQELSFFDLVNVVVGAVVGADIYVATAITAGLLGPASVVAWVLAGAAALCLALVFARCGLYVPKVGGPFAYVGAAFGNYWALMAGWSLWIAEIMALPVFALAFVNYLRFFASLSPWEEVGVKAAFLLGITAVNVRGVRLAGRVNDVLTIAKLVPLPVLVLFGLGYLGLHPATLRANYVPFTPMGVGALPSAVLLVFWAYVGFELGTMPASEVKDPRRTIPRAVLAGMIIVTVFYLATNFVVYGLVAWRTLALSATPLVAAGSVVLGSFGAKLMGVGALVSVSGSDESGTLGTARLSYAMALEGLFPKPFSWVHPRFKTPYVALLAQGGLAFLLSLFSGITALIAFSVVNMAFAFLLTCLSLRVLQRGQAHVSRLERILPWTGTIICLYLIWSTPWPVKVSGLLVMLAGVPLYVWLSPKTRMELLWQEFLTDERLLRRALRQRRRFLANLLHMVRRLISP